MKRPVKSIIAICSAVILAGTLLLIFFFQGSVKASLDGNSLFISSYYMSKTPIISTYIDDLSKYESGLLYNGFEKGEKIDAQENLTIKCGRYKNSNYGEYTLHSYSGVDYFIVLREKGGTSIIIFNLKSAKATQNLYNKIHEIAK